MWKHNVKFSFVFMDSQYDRLPFATSASIFKKGNVSQVHTPSRVTNVPSTTSFDWPAGPVDSLSIEKDQRDSCKPLIEVSSSSWMATMEPCMHCCTIKTNHSARRWLFGYCMRLMPWEMLSTQYIWMGRGFSLMREDFRVCYELWTGGTAGPMVSAREFVRLEGSH